MSRSTVILNGVLTALCATLLTAPLAAQEPPAVPADQMAKQLPRQTLSGPRFGFTTFTGETADRRDQAGLESIMTQFGWQFETQILSLTGGQRALMEWVLLVGGVEQDELNLSLGWLTGYRLSSGFELGVGPNFSYSKDSKDVTTSMVFAGGATLPFGDLFVPINLAVAVAKGGPRITVLTGWIIG
jgi:hypothetical protein